MENLAGPKHSKVHFRTLTFRVTPIEAALIEANAKHFGKTLSGWMRDASVNYRPRGNTEVLESNNTVNEALPAPQAKCSHA